MRLSTFTAIVVLLVTSNSNAQGYQRARAGDIAAGVALDERHQRDQHPPTPDNPQNPERLSLNVTPCEDRPTVMEFHKPYRVLRVEQATCNGGPYPGAYVRIQVEQGD
jgi:hypothetical protein